MVRLKRDERMKMRKQTANIINGYYVTRAFFYIVLCTPIRISSFSIFSIHSVDTKEQAKGILCAFGAKWLAMNGQDSCMLSIDKLSDTHTDGRTEGGGRQKRSAKDRNGELSAKKT